MKKWGFFIALTTSLIVIAWVISEQKDDAHNTLVYTDYDIHDNSVVKSETTYISDSSHTFKICQSRDGKTPCKEVSGVKHGIQKWYGNGILKYEDFYNHGNRTHTIAYYDNGLKRKECLYQNNKLSQTNIYGKDSANSLIETIFYKDDEEVRKYYIHSKLRKEEKYRNNKLVSRKIYGSDGLLQRLEEYNFIGNDIDSFDNFFEGLDSVNPFLFDFENPNPMPRQYKDNNTRDNSLWI
ncbi:toxin-antitoxin system YwqK family antitoxin [Helicobacter trogontum]|uniref:Toxin-antitoxin system YwqK family antitoxin n=1 Tax=Helicobacter trogontum TaxID=50960 RepID=A0A4U8SCA6_9HELI|nr:hypothetical protein [Helicobacter trogontum]TLD83740.1 hypothetical protein LS81_004150 [Helicobacter trogontum]